MQFFRLIVALGIWLAVAGFARAADNSTIRIAFIDPLTGPMANSGDTGVKHFQYFADAVNAAGGIGGRKLQIIPFDSAGNPERAKVAFGQVADQGIRYIVSGISSAVSYALIDAVGKFNRRNPDNAIMFLNYAALDPGLTGEKCSKWFFRFAPNSDLLTAALVDYVAKAGKLKTVYNQNEDYTYGRAVERETIDLLKQHAPNVKVVGSDFVPLATVKDFSPYIAKVIASQADAIFTGNYGSDLTLLIKAASDSGYKGKIIALNGMNDRTPREIGMAGKNMITVAEWVPNMGKPELASLAADFEKQKSSFFYYYRVKTLITMLGAAIARAKSDDPRQVMAALEGAEAETDFGKVYMRKTDHQLFQPLYVSEFTDSAAVKVAGTELGFVPLQKVAAKDTEVPSTCSMSRD